MSDSPEVLDKWLAQLNQLGNLAEDVVPEVAKTFEVETLKQIAASTDPDGKAWAPRKDGKRPLQNAGKALKVTTNGTVVIATLDGHIARHHHGRVKGKITRQILPKKGELTHTMGKAIGKVVDRRFSKIMNGGERG